MPLSVRPMPGTAAPRSLDPSKATTASECLSRPLERRGWPGLSLFLNYTTAWTGTGQRAHRSGPRCWQAIDRFRSEQRSCLSTTSLEAQTVPAPFAERSPRRMSRFLSFAAFDLSALGNSRPGAETAALDVSYPAPSLRGHRRQTVKPHTAGARRQDRAGQLSGKAPLTGQEAPRAGTNLGTRETTLRRTDAELPQR